MRVQERMIRGLPAVPVLLLVLVLFVLVTCGTIAATLYFPPLILVVFGAIGYLLLGIYSPLAGYVLVVWSFIFKPALLLFPASGTRSTGFVNTLTVADFVLLGLLVALACRTLFGKDLAILRAVRSHALFFMLIGALLVSVFPGLLHATSIPWGISNIMRLVNGMLLALFALLVLRTHEDLVRFAWWMMPVFLAATAWGWYEVITGEYILANIGRPISEQTLSTAEAGFHRAIGPTGDPVYYSVVLTFGMAMGLLVFHHAGAFWKRWSGLLIMAMCAGTILTTGARGGLLAAFVLLGVYFFFVRMKHKVLVLTGISICVIAGMSIYAVTISTLPMGRLAVTGGEKDETTTHRLGLYTQSRKMFADSPLIGVGYGEFPRHQARYFDWRPPRYTLRPHSVFLQLLAEDGIFAFAIYISILAYGSLNLFALVLRLEDPGARITAVILLGLVLAYALFATNTNLLEDDYVWMSLAFAQVARVALENASKQDAAT
jgi:hypothetical protein